jgi:hypothetical protein
MPDDDRIAVLIPWYANDSLSPEERLEVEAHLPDCAECRGLLEEARVLQGLDRQEPAELLDHVQAQHLERFAADPGAMPPETTGWIREHLQGCEVCRDALHILRGALAGTGTRDAAADSAPPRGTPEPVPAAESGSIWHLLSRTIFHPAAAAAYLVALCLAIPVYRALAPHPAIEPRGAAVEQEPGPAGDWGGAVDLQVLSSAFRGEEDVAAVVVEAGQPVLPLGVEFELPAGLDASAVVGVVIRDGAGEVVWSQDLTREQVERNLDHSGIVTLLLPGSRFTPGRYRLTVERGDRPDGRPLLDAPFEVVLRAP